MQLWLAALGGMILKLDHSYKVVNKVRDPSGAKQYKAVLSVMNEFCQVRLEITTAKTSYAWMPTAAVRPCGNTRKYSARISNEL